MISNKRKKKQFEVWKMQLKELIHQEKFWEGVTKQSEEVLREHKQGINILKDVTCSTFEFQLKLANDSRKKITKEKKEIRRKIKELAP